MPGSSAKTFDFSTSPEEFRREHVEPFWQRRMVELSALGHLVQLESPGLAGDCDLVAAYGRLRAKGAGISPRLWGPELLLWINVSRYLVMRDIHRSLPIGHVHDHFSDLQRFAFSAAVVDRRGCSETARIQRDGRVSLPGTGLALQVNPRHAGKIVALETDGTLVTAALEARKFAVALEDTASLDYSRSGEGWIAFPRLDCGILLDDSAEMARPHCANNPAWKVRQTDPDYVRRWLSSGNEACRLIAAVEGDLWVPVRDVLTSIIPLESRPDVNLSGTCDEVLGCICSSLPANTALLAETLAHEAAHTALHMLTDGLSYWLTIDAGQLYRSPWRKDLRPISGMMHGIFAFLAVGEFWARLLQQRSAREFEELGRFRLSTVTRQVKQAIAEINQSPELTEAGRGLLLGAERKLEAQHEVSRAFVPTAEDGRAIEERLARHVAGLAELPRGETSSTRSGLDARWSRELGVTMPPPANHPGHRRVRREAVSDRIQSAACKNDPVVRKWEKLLRATGKSEPESAALVGGSISYGRGDFAGAVKSYAAYVERRWDDVDAWRLLGAALRRTGRSANALTIVFDLHDLQRRTAAELRNEFGPDWPFHLHRLVRGQPRIRKSHAS
jgi:HEXXH motif-containing protein